MYYFSFLGSFSAASCTNCKHQVSCEVIREEIFQQVCTLLRVHQLKHWGCWKKYIYNPKKIVCYSNHSGALWQWGKNERDRASDISRGRGPAKFRYFREIPRNSQKNAKYREIRQKYFQIHVGKTYLILILAFRPVLFTSNVQIYLETSSLQGVNNVPKLPGVLRLMLRKTGHQP